MHTTLISAAELRALLAGPQALVLLDASFDLADTGAGEAAWRAGHLPGSRYVHLESELSGPKTGADGVFRGRHPLPDIDAFAAAVGEWGITPATQVVVLDRQGSMMAARAWWLLRWLGHRAVAVLDGGVAAWQAAGGELVQSSALPAPAAPYPRGPLADRMPTIEAAELLKRLGQVGLLDARAPERYRGEVEPLDACAGHIPGARNRFFKDNLQSDGRYRPAVELRAAFDELLSGRTAQEVVQQCGSGVTACHNLLAMEIAGLPGSVLYPGSWSEWSADPARPVARG
jgi:thiosulfate/3-mercaptopyruvate sulfurtransferase